MEKLLLKTPRQIHVGQVLSGLGFVLYLTASAFVVPDLALLGILLFFGIIALWTLLSILALPEEESTVQPSRPSATPDRESHSLTRSRLWGQGALTILLLGCAYLTLRGMLRG